MFEGSNNPEVTVFHNSSVVCCGLISRGEIFVDWIAKNFCGYIFEVTTISPDKFHYNESFCG